MTAQSPDFNFRNTRLSPKSIVFPQSEDMFTYTLDTTREDANLLKDAPQRLQPEGDPGHPALRRQGSHGLVRMNFDTDEYKDPYWLELFDATTFIGLACDNPCSTCFCTTAGCGPYHEEGLDVLLSDQGDHYLAKSLTDKGAAFLETAGWKTEASTDLQDAKAAAEAKIVSTVDTGNLKAGDTLALHGADFWEDVSFALHQLRDLHLCVPHLLVFRHPG